MKGYTHIYTGNGKGKTTAALGLALRAMGHGRKICMIQFLKRDENYGEYRFLKDKIDFYQFGSGDFINDDGPSDNDIMLARQAYEQAVQSVQSGRYDIVILDEIIVAFMMGLLDEKAVLMLMKMKAQDTELIMTGRGATEKMIESADLVTEMKEVKHYYKKGITAREGIEY